MTLNLWLIVEFCHKTTALPQAGFLPRRVTYCQAKQRTGGRRADCLLPQAAVVSGFQRSQKSGTLGKFRSMLSPLNLLQMYCVVLQEKLRKILPIHYLASSTKARLFITKFFKMSVGIGNKMITVN